MSRKYIDRIEQRHGRLVYKKLVGVNKFGKRLWEAVCDCGKVVTVIGGTCESCGCLMHEMASKANQHPKSEATKKKLSEIRKIKDTLHTCPVCNKEFIGTKFQRFCSVYPCQKRYFAAGSHRDRAREHGGKVEAVRFWKMYERDKGICQECGVFCPKELRGDLTQKLSPTMGHTLPLSRGGDHTYANVQLECWGCNSKKSNAMPEGVVEPRINPDPRTRIQKIIEETRKAMQRPEVQEKLRAPRPGACHERPEHSKKMTEWFAVPGNLEKWRASHGKRNKVFY